MDNQQNLRGLIEGAILAAMWVLLLFITIFTPLFIITVLLLPVPFTILTYRRGLRSAVLAGIAAVILSVIFNLLVIGFTLVLYSLIVGIVTGYCLFHKKTAITTFASTVLAVLGSNLLGLLVLAYLADYNMITDITATMQESFAASESLLQSLGLSAAVLEADIEMMVEVLRILLPTILIAVSVVVGYLYYQVVGMIMGKLGEKIPSLPSLAEIRLPKKILWYFVFASVGWMYLALTGNIDNFMYILLLNIVQILSLVLALQGLGLVWYYMKKKNWPKWARIPLFIILLHPILLQIMTWVGMFDIFFNWRKLGK